MKIKVVFIYKIYRNDKTKDKLRYYQLLMNWIMELNLFGEIEAPGITIEQAAKTANVSIATIRLWIKSGYLSQTRKGIVSQYSLEKFLKETAGKEKLNIRANKLQKDLHTIKKHLKMYIFYLKNTKVSR